VNERHVDEAIEGGRNKADAKTGFWSPYTWKVLAKVTGTSDKNHEQEKNQFKTSEIYDFYKQICKKEGSDPLSLNRARRHLKRTGFLGID